jgi:hypothetical protein
MNKTLIEFFERLPPPIGDLKQILDYGFRSRKDFQYFMLWNEHDAIHYLTGLNFTRKDEIIVAKIEKDLGCGFQREDSKIFAGCEYQIPEWLNQSIITETAYKIKDCYFNRRRKLNGC